MFCYSRAWSKGFLRLRLGDGYFRVRGKSILRLFLDKGREIPGLEL